MRIIICAGLSKGIVNGEVSGDDSNSVRKFDALHVFRALFLFYKFTFPPVDIQPTKQY